MKTRKILSLAMAAVAALTLCVVPALAGTAEVSLKVPYTSPSGTTYENKNVDAFGEIAPQVKIIGFDAGAGKAFDPSWVVDGFSMKIFYTGTESDKPMSVRFWAPQEDGTYPGGNGLSVYPSANGAETRHETIGDGTFAISITYQDMIDCFAKADWNDYADTFSDVAALMPVIDHVDLKARNTGTDAVVVTKVEVTSPAIGGGEAPATDEGKEPATDDSKEPTTPVTDDGVKGDKENNPQTGDSAMIIIAVLALTASAGAVFFMKKRVEA